MRYIITVAVLGLAATPCLSNADSPVPPRIVAVPEKSIDEARSAAATVETPTDASGSISFFGNPGITGGLVYPDDPISLTSQMDRVRLTGSRTKAQIARTIELTDAQTGPQSGPTTPTPDSASYGLSITGYRPNWAASNMTGEMDGISVVLRQGSSDTATLLSNVGVRNGFAATIESYTFAADSSGTPLKGLRTQLGVANPRDNSYMGLGLAAENGTDLSVGLNIYSSSNTSSWARYLQVLDPSGSDVFFIRGADGTAFTHTLAPTVQFGGNVGSPGLEYNTYYGQFARLRPVNFEALIAAHPCNSDNAGLIARINNSGTAVTSFNQIINAGGGANSALITCDGANWRALSS